jgi:hypothetical protein
MISYEVTIVSNNGDKEMYDYYKNKYGDTLVVDFQSNGNMKRIHKNATLDYQLYSAEDGAVIFVYHNSDIDTFPCVDFSLNRIHNKSIENEEIMGKDCNCYEIMSTAKSDGDSVLIEACYPKNNRKLFLSHKLYRTYKDYYIHELFRKNKAPYFKYYIHYPEVSIKYDGLKVERKE